jgi:molybdopterin-guanine dinucleotide biosynthesis protein A
MTRWKDSHGHTQYEPLLAIYTPTVLPLLVEKIKSAERSLWSLAQIPRALFWNIPTEDLPQLINLNDPATLQAYLEFNP